MIDEILLKRKKFFQCHYFGWGPGYFARPGFLRHSNGKAFFTHLLKMIIAENDDFPAACY